MSGKQARGREFCASLLPGSVEGVLPVVDVVVGSQTVRSIVDSGCSVTLAHVSLCEKWHGTKLSVRLLGSREETCLGEGFLTVRMPMGREVVTRVYVMKEKPFGVSLLLGLNTITALGGVWVGGPNDVKFGPKRSVKAAMCGGAIETGGKGDIVTGVSVCDELSAKEWIIEKSDFVAKFDRKNKKWGVKWKWAGEEPKMLKNGISEYKVPKEIRVAYDSEIKNWWACTV